MKERLTREILGKMLYLDTKDQEYLKNVLAITLNDYEVTAAKNEIVVWDKS